MTEMIFIATVLYVAYVVYLAKTSCDDKEEVVDSTPEIAVAETVSKKEESAVVTEKKPVAKKPAAKKPAATKAKAAAAITEMPTGSLRNPETGDLVKLANSYQMTRKWVKEALVTEGLLEKIYKTNELDDDTKTTIYGALDKMKAMSKYQ